MRHLYFLDEMISFLTCTHIVIKSRLSNLMNACRLAFFIDIKKINVHVNILAYIVNLTRDISLGNSILASSQYFTPI